MIQRQFFHTLSYVFHPIFIPLLGFYFLFSLETRPVSFNPLDALFFFPDQVKLFTYVVIAILTIIAPVLSLLIMYANKMISSFTLERREDRVYPFILVSFYYLLAYIFIRVRVPIDYQHPAFVGFMFGVLVLFFTCFVVNFYVKVSLHAAAIFGLCGMLIGYNQTQMSLDHAGGPTNLYIILYVLILAGIISAGRIYLKAHTLSEILLGSTIGFLVVFVSVKYGVYI